jgi:CheY-like chemotaxis protein
MAIAADAGEDRYALVLMDLQMPEVDGFDAARRIRAAGIDARRLPILALTANAYADDIAACLHAGMQAHLAKPLNGAALDAAIARWTSAPVEAPKPRSAARFSPQLRERYATRRQELIDAVAALAEGKRVTDAEVAEISRMLHKFLGSAEMFGDVALAREARALEEGFTVWSRSRRIEEVRLAADAMRRAA